MLSEPERKRARAMREQGATIMEISLALDVSYSTAWYASTPGGVELKKERNRAYYHTHTKPRRQQQNREAPHG